MLRSVYSLSVAMAYCLSIASLVWMSASLALTGTGTGIA